MYETLECIFSTAVQYGILAFEAVGVVILLIAAVRALICLFKDKHKSKHILYDGISTALTFLLGSEILKTIVTPDWKDVGMTCAVLLMRAAMTLLIHWENKHEND